MYDMSVRAIHEVLAPLVIKFPPQKRRLYAIGGVLFVCSFVRLSVINAYLSAIGWLARQRNSACSRERPQSCWTVRTTGVSDVSFTPFPWIYASGGGLLVAIAPVLLADYVTTGNGLKNGVHCGLYLSDDHRYLIANFNFNLTLIRRSNWVFFRASRRNIAEN